MNQNLTGVSVNLTKEKSEQFFHLALCNGLDYVCSCYGLEFKYNEQEYKNAKNSLAEKIKKGNAIDWNGDKLKSFCWEDVLMEILRNGGKLKLVDTEGIEGTKSITIKTVHDRVKKTPLNHLIEYINETGGDAVTADVVIQTVFLNDIVYG